MTPTSILARLSGGSTGLYKVRVVKPSLGSSIESASNVADFKYEITVTSITPATGGKNGGTELTITGTHFSVSPTDN